MITLTATTGSDAGKVFTITKAAPLEAAALAVRIVSALNAGSYSTILTTLTTQTDPAALADAVFQLFQGCNPDTLKAVVEEVLAKYVRINPDATSPNFTRPLTEGDLTEVRTLLELLTHFVKLHI